MNSKLLPLIGASLAFAVSLPAQTEIPVTPPTDDTVVVTLPSWPQTVATTITLGKAPLLESLVPLPYSPPVPVNISPGNPLHIVPPFSAAEIVSIAWYKNSALLPTTTRTLDVPAATPADSGNYYAVVTRVGGESWWSDVVTVRIAAPLRQQFLNLSSRATISSSNPMLIGGFVVGPSPGDLHEGKTVLVRAVGPSLAKFGVTHPLPAPKVRFFDSHGNEIIQVILGGVETATPLATVLPELFQDAKRAAEIVGAFPLLEGASDYALVMGFPAGPFSIQVTGQDGAGGDVLLEIYEIPDSALPLISNYPYPPTTPVIPPTTPIDLPPVAPSSVGATPAPR